MKYFIDKDNCKVGLFDVCPTIKDNLWMGRDLKGHLHYLSQSEIFEDGEDSFVEISIPLEFPKGFIPPVCFDKNGCYLCPFYNWNDDYGADCGHQHYEKEHGCPIRKHLIK